MSAGEKAGHTANPMADQTGATVNCTQLLKSPQVSAGKYRVKRSEITCQGPVASKEGSMRQDFIAPPQKEKQDKDSHSLWGGGSGQ